ncbi:MAG: energy-coupling factor ABC transporter ATP-binding protein [Herpetosiphonaceae bacterium]|nr:energy-coupling factor ABC transporter ATP-binding protein [Herpetosiphonaceae bacterium]
MIRFEHVTYAYPNAPIPVLNNVSFTIAEGEFVLLAGASGVGKSTLLRAINGLVPHFYGGNWGGRVVVAGRDTRTHEPRALADVVGMVLQDPEAQMVADLVEDELVFGMENLAIDPRVMRRRVEEVLDQLEIAHLRQRRTSSLSGGERQRVAIAAVLALQPQILVLDEPTSQLDPHGAEEVLTAVQKLNADLGLTVVLGEHRLERVVQYVDRVLFLEPAVATDRPGGWRLDTPEAVLRSAPFAPPLVEFGRTVGWQPLPLTIKAARQYVTAAGWDRPISDTPATIDSHATQQRNSVFRRRRSSPPPQEVAALGVRGLSVQRDGRTVLREINVEVASGELLAIMGRNGSGKTTLLRAIMGLQPYTGHVRVDGQLLDTQPTEVRARSLGYVPQDPRALLFQPSVGEELRWTLLQHGITETALIDTRIAETLKLLGLLHLAERYPRDLSSGEQQRVALAALLVVDPPVLLLDEPTRGMDYHNKASLVDGLKAIQQAGHTVVLVTHDVELVASCADRIVILGEGEVVVEGPPQTLLNDSLLFSSQIGKLFRHRPWLTAPEALTGLAAEGQFAASKT